MKISIVTVTYNSGLTLADTLRSVAMQSHPDIEHIVIDGASTDDTLDVLGRHGAHVSRIISEPDRGIYDAMNKGMQAATGDFIGFLNADDMLANREAIAAIAAAASAPSVNVVYGDLVYVKQSAPNAVVRTWEAGPFERRQLKFGWMPPHPTMYVRRSLIDRVGGFDLRFRIAADYDFMLRCLRDDSLEVRYVPSTLVLMRTGGASNRSLRALWQKSMEDVAVIRKNRVGGIPTLLMKNLRKLPQFIAHRSSGGQAAG